MSRLLAFLPVVALAALALLLWRGFDLDDPHRLPSSLLNKPFPAFALPDLNEGTILSADDLTGEIALVNLWATWCTTCYAEHQMLLKITRQYDLPIYGINYKDDQAKAKDWLSRLGNPYRFSVVDQDGRLGIELGVYGAPETFIIDAQGVIRYKRIGDVNERIWRQELWPIIQQLRTSQAADEA